MTVPRLHLLPLTHTHVALNHLKRRGEGAKYLDIDKLFFNLTVKVTDRHFNNKHGL